MRYAFFKGIIGTSVFHAIKECNIAIDQKVGQEYAPKFLAL